MLDFVRLSLSFALSFVIGGLGYWRRSLTGSGWLGAVIVGTATAGVGGWTWGALVVIFFATSSALSHWRRAAKHDLAADKFSKTERRDLVQTLANGGAAAVLAIAYGVTPHPLLFAAALGVLATVTADTWATEIGTLSQRPPRLITNGQRVAAGTSGGVTPLGFGATAAGALLIGVSAYVLAWFIDDLRTIIMIPAALAGGAAGSLADSILGATVQAINWCPHCLTETERTIHRCGTRTQHLRGSRWLTNDWVNFGSSLVGGVVGALVWLLLR